MKELKVSWLSNERQSIVLEVGQQKKIVSIALVSPTQMFAQEEDQLQNIRVKVDAFLKRNPKFWEAP